MKQKHYLFVFLIIIVNIIFQSWRVLPKYYKSLMYVSFINSCYYYLFKKKLLWEFNDDHLKLRRLRALHLFIGTPLLVLGCLSHFPTTLAKQIIHILTWTIVSSIGEWFAIKNKLIVYKNGWNSLWSGLIYIKMYTFSYLFQKRPLFTLVLSVITVIFYSIRFRIPLDKQFLKGPLLL